MCVQQLVNNPTYIGLRHKRVRGQRYDDLIDEFLQAVTKRSVGLSVSPAGRSVIVNQLETQKNAHSFSFRSLIELGDLWGW